MSTIEIELFSDTKTKPSQAMLDAMMQAECGDEQAGEDPTTLALQERVADLLGKEAALFVPSGTMCNQIAMAVQCQPGDEIIADKTAHIINFEAGGPAVIARAMIKPLDGIRGQYTLEQAREALRAGFRHAPSSKMIAVEQTANLGGGSIWPLAVLQSLKELAAEHNLVSHMDGARLLNAVVASGVSAKDYAATVDTVWIDLSKGLGCPIGGVIAGTKDFIEQAWPWKQRLGGSMRQSGVLAAAGLYALDHNVDRLAIDHANARTLATRLAQIPGVKIDPLTVETNILIIDVGEAALSAPEISERLLAGGVRMGAMNPTSMRAVTHLDVDEAGVSRAADLFAEICS
ncbi:MAG: threonine aldolase family protein [Rhodospirillaceae bacterium]|jgi:threonine aldolase|nr:threonine aldolase family protein [Rhodospirillaceae bacterium]MBT4588720.1 threonine aldolase family protein [Rhodospirillaceae bacterium]